MNVSGSMFPQKRIRLPIHVASTEVIAIVKSKSVHPSSKSSLRGESQGAQISAMSKAFPCMQMV